MSAVSVGVPSAVQADPPPRPLACPSVPPTHGTACDESRHAALAWDTLDGCCAAGGEAVKRAVADALKGVGRGRPPYAA